MKSNLLGSAVLVAGLSLIAVACGQSYGNTGGAKSASETTAGVQGRDANDAAIEKLSSAKCERETRCGNIGDGKKFATERSCMDENRGAKRDDLRTSDCPGGIDKRALDKCLAEIRAEHCSNALDKINRLTACRDNALCID